MCYEYALNCHPVYFDNTGDTSVMYEKATFVCFIYIQPPKLKFKSVQINMKQVSHTKRFLIDLEGILFLDRNISF